MAYRCMLTCAIAGGLVSGCLLAPPAAYAAAFSRQDLGTLGGSSSTAYSVNTQGDVCGYADTSQWHTHAFLWSAATGMTDLGALAGYDPGWQEFSWAEDLNDARETVGGSQGVIDGGLYISPVAWMPAAKYGLNAGINELDGLPSNLGGVAEGINNKTQIVGCSYLDVGLDVTACAAWLHLFEADYERAAGTHSIGYLYENHNQSAALDVNEHGIVVGTSSNISFGSFQYRPFTWDANPITGGFTALPILDPDAIYAFAADINKAGAAVGSSDIDSWGQNARATLWENGAVIDLGTLDGSSGASGINNWKGIVGEYIAGTWWRAAYWRDGAMSDLNSLVPAVFGWTLSLANEINDNGLIVGEQWHTGGTFHAFLLTPECPSASIVSAVPSSATIDARQPFPYQANPPVPPDARQGIGSPNSYTGGPEYIEVTLSGNTTGAEFPICWELCETGIEAVEGGPSLGPNAIRSVDAKAGSPGVYRILLDRPISAGYWTRITYNGGGGAVWYASLPGDANASRASNAQDITALVNCINMQNCAAHRADIDHSGQVNAQDVTALTNLLNGAGQFTVWNGKTISTQPATCGEGMMAGGGGGEMGIGAADDGAADEDAADDGGAFAKEFVAYLATATPDGAEEVEEFTTIVDALTGWVLEHFTPEVTAGLVEMLTDPSLTFASPTAADAAAKVVEVLTQ